MAKAKRKSALLEALESRTLLSATPIVMGYLTDYKIANTSNKIFSENSNGSIANDNLDWKDLTQVNYFALLPDATPAYNGTPSSEATATSDGGIQALSDSGDNPAVQLPALVSDANGYNVKVYATVGAGDPTAIYDMDALVNSPSEFSTFAANIQSFCNKYGLPGVDLDWEPTGQSGFTVTTTQIDNYGNLIATIKKDDPSLGLTAEALGDPVALSNTGGSNYMLNHVAIANLDAINVEAYPVGSEAEANTIMQDWDYYVTGTQNPATKTTQADVDGVVPKSSSTLLQYGLDISSDDTSNTQTVVEDKVNTTHSSDFGGLFVFDLDSDTGSFSVVGTIGAQIAKDYGTTSTGGSVSGTVATSSGAGVSGVTVYLDANNNGTEDSNELHTTTTSNGTYSFTDVPAGAYVVRQNLPSGDTQTSPADGYGIHITVSNGSSSTGDNFVDTVPNTAPTGGSVSGTIATSSGAGVSGVTVYLDANNNGTEDSNELHTTTASNGTYSFTNVPAGAYIVRQILPSGDTQTSPSGGYGIHITVSNGSSSSGDNFVDTVPNTAPTGGSVSGTVATSGGAGVSGVTVYLDANNNGTEDSNELHTTTASNGSYSFTNVPAGAYVVRQILPSGDTQTSPADGYGIHITVSNGSSSTGDNFVDTVPNTAPTGGSVSGTVSSTSGAGISGVTVYLDANNNGTLDSNELHTTTASNGTYSFTNVPAGAYVVRQILPSGDTQTSPADGYGIHITVSKGSSFTGDNFTDTVPTNTSPAELTGTVIGSSTSLDDYTSGHSPANAFDNSVSTVFEDSQANGNWIGLNLGKAYTITQIRYAADPANPSYMEGGVFQGSDTADFSSGVVDLYQVPNTTEPSTSYTTVNISSGLGSFQYVRYLPPAGSYGDVAEADFFGTAG